MEMLLGVFESAKDIDLHFEVHSYIVTGYIFF